MRRIALSSIILILAAAPSVRAEMEVFHLRNGGTVAGPILKETTAVYYVDLGFDVLSLPRDQVATHTTMLAAPRFDTLATTAPAIPIVAAAPGASTATQPTIVKPVTVTARRFSSINDMIAACAESVGVVSTPRGLGAGFVITEDGRLLTNFHVVNNERFCDVTLFFRNGERKVERKFRNAEVMASSALMDIALVKLPEKQLEGVKLQAMPLMFDPLEVGTPVYAIGNPGMGREVLEHSVSEGIVSSRQRNIGDVIYLQTTAAVNPGNSGGPLVSASGQVVGLVTYKAFSQDNIAFALPTYYITHFIGNQEAYAFGKLHPNTGFRYLSPE